MADSQHDDTFGARRSGEDGYLAESHFRVSEQRAGEKMTASELRERPVRVANQSATHRGEPDATETEHRFHSSNNGVRHDQQSAAVERRRRASHREERERASCSRRERQSRILRERRRNGSESPRRHRHFDGYRYREELGRRSRCWKSPSMGYFSRRRYPSPSSTVSRSQSRQRDLYRRKLCHPERRAHCPTRSTEEDRHDIRLRNVTSNEPAPHESGGHFDTAPSSELEASTERPVLLAANWQTERIIPKVQLAGYHLQDPRRKDYGSRFRDKSIREGYNMENRTTSTLEKRNIKQLYDNNSSLAGPSSQIHSVKALPLVICADNSRSDMYGAARRDNGVAQHTILQTPHHRSQEYANFCPRPIESPANRSERRPMPEYFVGYPPMVPMSEMSLVTNCPRPLANDLFPGQVSQAGGQPLKGLDERGTETAIPFQNSTTGGASTMNQAPQDGELSWYDKQRYLRNRVIESMIQTLRSRNDEVDSLRCDMRDLRQRIATFAAKQKKEREESLAFIAAVKECMENDD
ncbi:hypothetical protein HPB50_009985 [Hyalomma asiaticum]|uniref:Uncharacterized protein n=1 Tax=Hyalomma asiaticum TaxID=266040 RepID=A0ACB7TIF3_HYAAI|nr:hypothetical protein HPB50_009985 [Hyalomma asiaticum]